MRGAHHVFNKMLAGHCTRQARFIPQSIPIGPNQPFVSNGPFVWYTLCQNHLTEYVVSSTDRYAAVVFHLMAFSNWVCAPAPPPPLMWMIVTARGIGSGGENFGGV